MDTGSVTRARLLKGFGLLGVLIGTTYCNAAPITWAAAEQVLNESSVVNSGTMIEAVNATNTDSGALTVNGVQFSNSNQLLDQVGFVGALAGTNTGSAPLNGLLNTFDYGNGTAVDLSVGGALLQPGVKYLIQVFFTDLRACCSNREMTIGDGLGNTVDLRAKGDDPGLGQYATGTFVADGAWQTLSLATNGFANAHISAYQIRQIPEPFTLALLSLGLVGVALGRTRR